MMSIYNAVRRQLEEQKLTTAEVKRMARSLFEDESDGAFVLYSACIDILDSRLSFQAFHRFQKSLKAHACHKHELFELMAG